MIKIEITSTIISIISIITIICIGSSISINIITDIYIRISIMIGNN